MKLDSDMIDLGEHVAVIDFRGAKDFSVLHNAMVKLVEVQLATDPGPGENKLLLIGLDHNDETHVFGMTRMAAMELLGTLLVTLGGAE